MLILSLLSLQAFKRILTNVNSSNFEVFLISHRYKGSVSCW